MAFLQEHRVGGLTPINLMRSQQEVSENTYLPVPEVTLMLAWALDVPLGEIAFAKDCASQSHMTDTFRSVLSTTPGKWRAEVRA
ncbi:hypothetical protein CEP88_00320 (plasmid) [Roseobacter denitrificans]|nr:hypothetical protein CEP88_00320 [Roseobacter denitrificans]